MVVLAEKIVYELMYVKSLHALSDRAIKPEACLKPFAVKGCVFAKKNS